MLYTKYPKKIYNLAGKGANQNLNDPGRTRCVFILCLNLDLYRNFPTHYVSRKDGSTHGPGKKGVEKEVTGNEKEKT